MAVIISGGTIVPAPPPGTTPPPPGVTPGAYAATVVYEQLRAPGGDPPLQATIRIRAEAKGGGPVYVTAAQTTLAAEQLIQLREEDQGNYEMTLDAQWTLSPAGSTYVVERSIPELGPLPPVRIAVPGATERAWLGNLIVAT